MMKLDTMHVKSIFKHLPIHKTIGVILISLVLSGSAHAELITYTFGGEIDDIYYSTFDPLVVGDTFTGSFTFESTAPIETNGHHNFINSDLYPGTGYSIEVNSERDGIFTVSGTRGNIILKNDQEQWGDMYLVTLSGYLSEPETWSTGQILQYFQLDLCDYTSDGEDIISDETLTAFPELALCALPEGRFLLTKQEGSNYNEDEAHVLITSFTSVPIPSAVWLLGSGMIGLAGFRRRFRE